MDVALFATPRLPVDGQATCEHAHAAFFARYRFVDPWRPVESRLLGPLVAALRAAGLSAAVIDPEAEAAAAGPPEGCPRPVLVAAELDEVVHLPGFGAVLARIGTAWPGVPTLAAGRMAAADPRTCLAAFPALRGVVGPDRLGRWSVHGRSDARIALLRPLQGRSVFEQAPDRAQLLRRLDRGGERPPARIDTPHLSGREAAAAAAALDPRLERVVLTKPIPLRLLPAFLDEFDGAVGGTELSLATGLDGTTADEAGAFAARLARGGRGCLARLSLLAAPADLAGPGTILLRACRQVGLPVQPVVRLVTTATEIGEVPARVACLRRARVDRLGQPGFLLNGLGLLPGDIDDDGAAWAERAFALAAGGPVPDFAEWVAWRCPRTAVLWGSLRPVAVELHERSVARIPAVLLGLRGGAPGLRRALTGLRADLGQILLDLADEAATTLLESPAVGRTELLGRLVGRLAALDTLRLGRPFGDWVEDLAS